MALLARSFHHSALHHSAARTGVAASRAARDAFCHDQRTTSVMLTARTPIWPS